MADVRAFRSGNWSDTTATSPWWNGTAIFAPAAGDAVYSNTFTIAVDVSATCTSITNVAASSRVWKDGGTATATAGGVYTLSNGVTLTANIHGGGASSAATLSGTNSAAIVGNVIFAANAINTVGITNSSSGVLTITGNVTAGSGFNSNLGVTNTSATGTVNITGNATGSTSAVAVNNNSTGSITITGNVTAGSGAAGANNASTGTFTVIGDITATSGANGFTSSNSGATNRLSGSFISAANGTAAVYATKYFLNTSPTAAKTRYSLNGSSTYLDMFTADNSLGQASPSDVRSGVSYASGSLTGTCAVPAAGSVALGVPVGSTTGTALLTGAAVASAVWDALTSSLTTSGSIGERIKNCSTAEITGEQLAAALSTP